MNRSRLAAALLCFGFALVSSASGLGGATALAQQVRPPVKGRSHKVKVDSSPQQAAVYWVAGNATNAKDYGIAGYTPITLKVPRGAVTIVVELQGFKPQTKAMDVRKSQNVMFTLERAPAVAKLDLQSTDGSATGADVKIDGASRGTMPNVFEVPAGRHQVEINKAGFKAWTQWINLDEGAIRTNDIVLARAEAPTGEIIVNSDAGGDVYVDGVRKDTAPTVVTGVPAGDHNVEVRKDGLPPQRQIVSVPAGGQAKVSVTFGASASNGSLRVIASEPDAEIFVDGEDKGRSPANIPSLAPGEHVVEARKLKFKVARETAHIVAGQSAAVQLTMELAPPDRPKAGLRVQSSVPNAEVFLDGGSLGRAPVDRNDLDPGKHVVVVHKDGYAEYRRDVLLVENQVVPLIAELSASGSMRILSTPEGASVRIDGELVGKTPVLRDAISAGDHVVELDLKGYMLKKETVKVVGGSEKVFSYDLTFIPTTTPAQVAARKKGMSSFGARSNPTGGVIVDFGAGYPYFLTMRATVGAFSIKPLKLTPNSGAGGIDLGVEFQTFFQMYNFSGHGRIEFLEAGPVALGARVNGGYGFGPDGRNSWFMDIVPIVSIAFGDVATVSATARLSLWDDKFCPTPAEEAAKVSAEPYCHDTTQATDVFPAGKPRYDFISGHRLYIGFAATAAIWQQVSVFAQLEFVPGVAPAPRPAFTDEINSFMLQDDTDVYGTAGLSLKF
jgi:hypothetical protein